MFRPREQIESFIGALALQPAGVSPGQDFSPAAPPQPVRARLAGWLANHAPDVDLAENIGSKSWWRTLALLAALCSLALSFWPDFAAVEPPRAIVVAAPAQGEFRIQAIAPLGLGADSGKRTRPGVAVIALASAPERATLDLVTTLGQGDSFVAMLARAGVDPLDASRAAQLAADKVPLGQIAPGTRFDITLGRHAFGETRRLEQMKFRARFDLELAFDRKSGNLAVSAQPIPVDPTPLRIRGAVGASLYMAARASGAPVKAIQQYLQALDPHISLEGDILPGDQFDIIVAHKQALGGQSETGVLLYAGLERDGKPIAQLLRWGSQMTEAADWGTRTSTGLSAPVNGHITSGYGMRYHPLLHYARMHAGVDFGAVYGSPIFAVTDGIVAFAGVHGGHGNYVKLDHGGGLGSGYGHMSRIAVAPGMRVHSGQVIGYVGSTGLSTGPHLHYEVYRNGQTINPLSVSFTFHSQVDAKQVAAFKAMLAQLKAIKVAGVPGLIGQSALSKPQTSVKVALVQREVD